MIGGLITAFLMSCFIVCLPLPLIVLAELGVRRLAKANSRRSAVWQFLIARPLLLASCLILPFLLTPLSLQVFLESTIREGMGAAYEEAARGHLHCLPACARDINYYSVYMGATADFLISEEDFLKWCDDQGWSPEEISREKNDLPVYIQYRGHPEWDCEIHNGLVCEILEHPRGTGAQIVYDRDSGRAYYNDSSW